MKTEMDVLDSLSYGLCGPNTSEVLCGRKATSGFQARSKDQEILEEGGGAGPSS